MLIGIDEVGRGCWAGPLVVGAVSLHKEIYGLTDSKKLSKVKREIFAKQIAESGEIGLGWVSNLEIDEIGLSAALRLAAKRAISQLSLNTAYEIIIDGNQNFLPQFSSVKVVVRADSLYPCVSAASIIAKVSRDMYMQEQAADFPQYGFEQHVGYGTKQHIAAIKNHGISSLHRRSFAPIKRYRQDAQP